MIGKAVLLKFGVNRGRGTERNGRVREGKEERVDRNIPAMDMIRGMTERIGLFSLEKAPGTSN